LIPSEGVVIRPALLILSSAMQIKLFIPSFLLAGVLFVLPATGIFADDELPTLSLPESRNKVISLGSSGISPSVLEMKPDDGIVLFLNDSADALVTLDLNFGKHATHCASDNLKIGDDGVIRSTQPIAPKDFATACFHDPGTYSYTIYGLKQAPQGLKGSIVVK